ncbi:MAG: NAD(P)-binding domain-containing protein [Devosia sp.]
MTKRHAVDGAGLPALEQRLETDLAWLNLPAKPWMPETRGPDGPVLDVAIVGAGVSGLVAAAMLRQLGIVNVRLFDRAAKGNEGPWVTFARMQTLRTAKQAAGMALGVPSLSFRAWFEAQFGCAAWDELVLAPRTMWMDYMNWYRAVTRADVQNDTEILAIEPQADGLIRLGTSGGEVFARRVVLASGLDGLGGPRLPDLAKGISKQRVVHGADLFDVAGLAGKRVGVVGAGASAMDNAAAALEAGAADVHIFVRRADIPRVDKFTGVGSKGMTHGFVGLSDDFKWQFMDAGDRYPVPPPRHSTQRVSRHTNAFFHLGSPIEQLTDAPDALHVTTPKGQYALDFMIFTTGFAIDYKARPELAHIAPHILTWGDKMGPERTAANPALAMSPYLADDFSFLEKTPGACPGLSHIACFAYAAVPSHGKLTSGIPAASDGADRLAKGLIRSFFAEDAAHHLARFMAFDTPELQGDEWTDADAQHSQK